MALNSDAVLKVGTGAFYTADVGTEMPDVADLLTPGDPWEHMGHTSLDEILNSTTEGGERTPLPSLQAPGGVRETVSAATRTYTINLLQFDTNTLKLFYGSNAEIDANGRIQIPETAIPTEAAWLFVFRDGSRVGALHAARTSIIGGEDFGISDTESLSRLALSITPMVADGDNSGSAITFQPPINVEELDNGDGGLGE
jgi:hypothetical protein